MSPEIFISTDVETDGPIPGRNSMLSIGAAAIDVDGNILGTFSANLHQLPEATPDVKTMEWWTTEPEAWAACRCNLRDPAEAMTAYAKWSESFGSRPTFVAYPAGFDFLFTYWYLMAFVGRSPFSFSAIDIKTFAMAVMGTRYAESAKRNMPKRWFTEVPHTHVAVEDAIGQGLLFVNMLRESRATKLVRNADQLAGDTPPGP